MHWNLILQEIHLPSVESLLKRNEEGHELHMLLQPCLSCSFHWTCISNIGMQRLHSLNTQTNWFNTYFIFKLSLYNSTVEHIKKVNFGNTNEISFDLGLQLNYCSGVFWNNFLPLVEVNYIWLQPCLMHLIKVIMPRNRLSLTRSCFFKFK